MSDEKTLKKIEKAREDIKFWLKAAERYIGIYEKADVEKKKEKALKSYESAKDCITRAVDKVIALGGTIDDIEAEITPIQQNVWKELYADADSNTIAVEKEIERIKKMIHEDLSKAKEKNRYDPAEPIETRDKNGLFRVEAKIGMHLRLASQPDWEKRYNDAWNYERDYETTKDKYFTEEEQRIIEKCVAAYDERQEYYDIKYRAIRETGKKLIEFSERLDEWGDERLAKVWTRQLYEEVFPPAVKEIYGKLPKKEAEEQAKEMTKRYIQFIGDEKAIAKAMEYDKAVAENVDAIKRQLNGEEPVTAGLLKDRSESELRDLRKLVKEEVEGQNMLEYYFLRETAGIELALFIAIYKYDPKLEKRKELLHAYSLEELGL